MASEVLCVEKMSVLVVENDRTSALVVKNTLTSAGYEVPAIVPSGLGALEAVERHTPDLILMDINLEGDVDGIETAERILQRRHVPIVYLTGDSCQDSIARANKTEPSGYILKPFTPSQLTTSVQLALQRNARHRESEQARMRPCASEMSDASLLDSIEEFLTSTEVNDLWVAYDPENREFYAGWDIGKNFRDVLRTVVRNSSRRYEKAA